MSGPKPTSRPLRVVNAVAPIRICDNGGWTDTWFAKHGKIFNIGVYPYAEVQVEVFPRDGARPNVTIVAENFGERYAIDPEKQSWDRHPLIEAAIKRMRLPGLASEVAFLVDKTLQGLGLYRQKIHVLSEMNKTIACSIDKAKAELGFRPVVDLEEGMRRSLKWVWLRQGGLDGKVD